MKQIIRNISLMFFPFLFMIIVNESTRLRLPKKGHQQKGTTAINPSIRSGSKCSWYCHQNTQFCKDNHVKILKDYFNYTDPMYFGIIQSLQSTGNYGLANILLLVIFFPLMMFVLLIKSLHIQTQIKAIKRGKLNQ